MQTPVLQISCRECGHAVPDSGSFCQHCGAPLKRSSPNLGVVCPDCGATNPPYTNFCHACGRRLATRSRGPSAAPTTASGRPAVAEGARLVAVRHDGSDGEAFPLPPDQIDIGRSEGDLHFDDPHLAPRHARILCRSGQYVLSPLETRNGVYVRTQGKCDLADGDSLLIGRQVLRFELLSDAEKALRPAVEHGVVLFGTPLRPPWARLCQLTAAGTVRDVHHLTRVETTLGREQGDIVFSDDEFLSRRHAQILFRGGHAVLLDLGSSNGTYRRLRGPHALSPGEMIRMGDELLRFELA